jgi:Bacterial TSP3 repeat
MAERHWADHGDVDRDGDGLSDEFEMNVVGTNPLNPDTDGDGLWDNRERDFGSSPLSPDTDGDNVPDLREVIVGTSPYMADTDWDGTSDYDEIRANTAWAPDFDGDGTPEWVEQVREHRDLDGDGLSTGDEYWLRTSRGNDDTDGDGMGDMYEVAAGRDPRVADPPSVPDGGYQGGPWTPQIPGDPIPPTGPDAMLETPYPPEYPAEGNDTA